MKIAVVLGTRPEIIKMSPIIRALEALDVKRSAPDEAPESHQSSIINHKSSFFLVHTGQHYSYNMDKVFFDQLKLPAAKYNLEVGSGTHGEQTAKILSGIEKVLLAERPDVVLVQGDTNTVLAGALAAAKLHIKVGHVEAGLRSYDRQMPEEINRILTDHCSDYLFAPTEKTKKILLSEGIPENKIFVTGNTIVDAVYQNLEIAQANGNILDTLSLRSKQYFLATIHRQENVDDKLRFSSILHALDKLSSIYQLPVIYPIHPRARKMMTEFNLVAVHSLEAGNWKLETGNSPSSHFLDTYNLEPKTYNSLGLHLLDPVDFFGFLQLEKHARLILTDSGGVQEESCILGTPCVTLRDNTERPETVDVGASMLAGTNSEKIIECAKRMIENDRNWKNPFGDGKAGERIISKISGGFNE